MIGTLEYEALNGQINCCGERGPAGKDASFDLLWENPDKESVFYGQDVKPLPLTDYRWLMIEFGRYTSTAGSLQATVWVPTDFTVANAYMLNLASTKVQLLARNFTKVNDTTLHFNSSMMDAVTKSTGVWDARVTDVAVLIPLRIYGIK